MSYGRPVSRESLPRLRAILGAIRTKDWHVLGYSWCRVCTDFASFHEEAREQGGDPAAMTRLRDPSRSLRNCHRVLILGRTGSGKTTLARQLSAVLGVPHVELDALYFASDLSTSPLNVLRERTSSALKGDRWVTDGNKKAVRDLVWPRADTIIWLDYPLAVSLWRLSKRALHRAHRLRKRESEDVVQGLGRSEQLGRAAKGVLTALRSHRGQQVQYPRMFAEPQNQHLAVVRLRTPRATRNWLTRVSA